MTRILLDVNVVVDVLLDRTVHLGASTAVWRAAEAGLAEALLAAHGITTVHYLIRKQIGADRAKAAIARILTGFKVAPIHSTVIFEAMALDWPDFEDAVTAVAAQHAECEFIVTRDPGGFRRSAVRALTPEQALVLIQSTHL